MIAFFPDLYEDELAYSWFSRYHVQAGHPTYSATAAELFGNTQAIPSPEFLVALTDEAYRMVTRTMPFGAFIEKHTMFPCYARFLPLERRKKAFNFLVAMDRRFYDTLYMRTNKTQLRKYMRYCPMCAAADREKYGETYWHRKHQLTGVNICVEHRCRLEDSPIGIASDGLRFRLIHAEEVVPYDHRCCLGASSLEYQVAEYVLQVFESGIDLESDVSVGKFLHFKLAGTGYVSARGEKVYARKLFEDISKFYGELPQNTIQAWWYIQKIFCAQNFHVYDICLLAMFLGISVAELTHMKLPGYTLHEEFDSRIFRLHEQGKTYLQIADEMGVSLDTVKSIGEKRYRSTRELLG